MYQNVSCVHVKPNINYCRYCLFTFLIRNVVADVMYCHLVIMVADLCQIRIVALRSTRRQHENMISNQCKVRQSSHILVIFHNNTIFLKNNISEVLICRYSSHRLKMCIQKFFPLIPLPFWV
jgi:hypothetical protein